MKRVESELELERLLASEDGELAASVATLRDRGPDAADIATLASRLAFQGLDVTPKPVPTSPNAWKKWALGGAGGLSAVLLWGALRAPAPAVSPAPTSAVALQATAAPQPATGRPQPQPVSGTAALAAPALAAAPALESDAGEAAPAPDRGESATPTAANEAASAARAPSQREPSQEPAAALMAARAAASPAVPRAGSSANTPVSSTAVDAPSEIALLRDARFALGQAPARALELSEQHARLYPRGKLTQERELLAITALVKLGRRTAALSRAASFERAFPASPYLRQVGELLQ